MKILLPVLAALAFLPTKLAAQTNPAAIVKTLAGVEKRGEIISISEQEVKLRIAGKDEVVPGADVVDILFQSAKQAPTGPYPYLEVALSDGTKLRCQALALRGKKVHVRLFSGLSAEFDFAALHYLLCDAHDDAFNKDFKQRVAKREIQDVLYLVDRQNPKKNNTYEGFVGEADETGRSLTFNPGGGALTITMDRVRGIILSQQAAKPVKPLCKLHDNFGNLLVVAKFSATDEGYRIETPGGLKLELSTPMVQRIDLSPGKIAWLSDMEPLEAKVTPILSGISHYRRGDDNGKAVNLEGGQMSLGRRVYQKGLAVHSRTELVYDVTGFNHFKCVVGIDDLVTGPAHAIVVIEDDNGNKLLPPTPVSSRDKPRELDIKIKGVSKLRILVEYGEDLDLGDHVDFADARVTK